MHSWAKLREIVQQTSGFSIDVIPELISQTLSDAVSSHISGNFPQNWTPYSDSDSLFTKSYIKESVLTQLFVPGIFQAFSLQRINS